MTSDRRVLGYLALPWTWDIRQDPDDSTCWIATIAELPDFFAAGSGPGEAAGNAREALRSHIAGYLATGTPIPLPKAVAAVAQSSVDSTETVEFAA